MGTTPAWLAGAARALAGAVRSRQVSDTELLQWINDGVSRLYDELTLADDSFYSKDYDFSVGSGTESAATAALPADFYRMRGLARWPDTPRSVTVTSQPFENRNEGVPGYVLRGNSITVVPWRYGYMAGNYRITYAPLPPQFGVALDINPAKGDGVVVGPFTEMALQVSSAVFSASDIGKLAYFYNCNNSVDNVGAPFGLLSRPDSTIPGLVDLNDAVVGSGTTPPVAEAFTADTFAVVANATGGTATSMVELDTLMEPFKHFIVCYAACKILAKKRQLETAPELQQMMQEELARVKRAAPVREAEPEAAPVLWRSSWRSRGWFNDGQV